MLRMKGHSTIYIRRVCKFFFSIDSFFLGIINIEEPEHGHLVNLIFEQNKKVKVIMEVSFMKLLEELRWVFPVQPEKFAMKILPFLEKK